MMKLKRGVATDLLIRTHNLRLEGIVDVLTVNQTTIYLVKDTLGIDTKGLGGLFRV